VDLEARKARYEFAAFRAAKVTMFVHRHWIYSVALTMWPWAQMMEWSGLVCRFDEIRFSGRSAAVADDLALF
jgi:hypothetical protein